MYVKIRSVSYLVRCVWILGAIHEWILFSASGIRALQ